MFSEPGYSLHPIHLNSWPKKKEREKIQESYFRQVPPCGVFLCPLEVSLKAQMSSGLGVRPGVVCVL